MTSTLTCLFTFLQVFTRDAQTDGEFASILELSPALLQPLPKLSHSFHLTAKQNTKLLTCRTAITVRCCGGLPREVRFIGRPDDVAAVGV